MSNHVREALAPWLAKHARRAWKPVCEKQRRWPWRSAPAAHFGGSPMLAADEPWPACAQCDRPMQFFLELPLAELPAGHPVRGAGTLQLFYCSTDAGDCSTWEPFSGSHLVRLLTGPAAPRVHPLSVQPFELRPITSWREIPDAPGSDECDELGLTSSDLDPTTGRYTLSCPDLAISIPDVDDDWDLGEILGGPVNGDKLGGWPQWIQTPEYPACPECKRRMDVVFQVDSEDHVPHMFGDMGTAHITQCPDHPSVLAFAWACS